MRYLILSLFLVCSVGPASLRGGQKGEHQDAERWDRRYDTEKYVYGRDPVQFLKEQIANLGKGKALCLAAGEGATRSILRSRGLKWSPWTSRPRITKMPGARQCTWCRG